jgi:hypothetical protein
MTTGTVPGWYPGRCRECAEPALEGMHRCAECRVAHNAREAARRKARRKAGQCTVCGAKATVVDGEPRSTCKVHGEYYRARAAG